MRYLLLTTLLFFAFVAQAAQPPFNFKRKINNIQANIYFLLDINSGKILINHQGDKPFPPASLTKIMTSYIVSLQIQQGILSKQDMVPISKKAWKMRGSRMFLEIGSKVSIEKLMQGLIVQSGNDAAIALAEYVAGNEKSFVRIMNQMASRMGMTNTHFVNATGWPEKNHTSTARDLAHLTQILIQEIPKSYKIYSQKHFTYNKIRQPNRNLLLWEDDSIDGVKTGYTGISRYGIIVSALRDGMRLVGVVMDSPSARSRARDGLRLLNFGFRYFSSKLIYQKDEIVHSLPIWKGTQENIKLKAPKSIYATIEKHLSGPITVEIKVPSYIEAPVFVDSKIGTIHITLPNKQKITAPLVAAHTVEKAGLFSRYWGSVVLFFQKLVDEDLAKESKIVQKPSIK